MGRSLENKNLAKMLADIERLNLRHPVSIIAERLGIDKGIVSAYLDERKTLSKKFIKAFYTEFNGDLKAGADESAQAIPEFYTLPVDDYCQIVELTKENGRRLEEVIRLCTLIYKEFERPKSLKG